MFSNHSPNVPLVFKEIMKNDAHMLRLRSLPLIPFEEFKRLRRERRDLTTSAEIILSWNKDKGNTK